MRTGIGFLAVIGAAVGVSSPAAAAPGGGATGLRLGATGEILYDSNQLRSGASPSGRRDDVRYSPSGSILYDRLLGRGSVSVNGTAGYDFFQNNSFLNRNRFGAGVNLTGQAGSRCSANVRANYSNRQNGVGSLGNSTLLTPSRGVIAPNTIPVTDDLIPPDDIGRLIDNRQIVVSYGINATCGAPGGRLSFGGGATHSSLDNGSPLRSFANSNSNVYSLFAGLGVFRPGQLQVNGSYSTISYPNNLIVPGAPVFPRNFNTGVKTYQAGLTYSRPIGNKLVGSVGLSYLTARPGGGQQPYSAPAYNISLSYRPGSRLSLAATGARSVLSSTGAGALYRVVDSVNLSAAYDISPSISARANAGLTANNYKVPFAIPGEPARRSDSAKIVGLGVTYQPRPLYDVGFYVSQSFRSSNANILNYNSTRASLTLSVRV